MANGTFKLLETFRTTFAGTVYKHRNSTLGNKIGPPYPFVWANAHMAELDYGAALTRRGDLYERRFR